jgi:uncharacterized protein YbjT (DUF2867 family)
VADAASVVAVDGAELFLGRAIVEELVARGTEVRAVVLDGDAAVPDGARRTVAPLGDDKAIAASLEGAPGVVMARKYLEERPSDRITFAAVHAERTERLLARAANAGASRFVYVGMAGSESGGPQKLVEAEHQAEKALAEASVPAVCLKTSLVVGPGDGHVARLVRKARRAGPAVLFVGQGWARSAPMPRCDFARCVAALLAADEFPTGTLGLGGRERLTAMEILQRLLKHYGRRKFNVHILESLARLTARISERLSAAPPVTVARLSWLLENRVPATNAARGLLGRFPRRFETAFGGGMNQSSARSKI